MLLSVSALLLTQPLTLLNDEKLNIRGVIVAVPQLSIFQNFLTQKAINVPGGLGKKAHKAQTLNIGSCFFQRSQSAGVTSPTQEEVETFWTKNGSILVMTHAKFREMTLPSDLRHYALVIDEAHHAPLSKLTRAGKKKGKTTYLGQMRDRWVERNGLCVQATATPWHTESGERIYTEEEPLVSITIAEMRRAGLSPKKCEMNRVMLDYEASSLKEWLLEHTQNLRRLTKAYTTIVEYWKSQKKPYTVIRIPDRRHVRALKKLFEKAGARVLDASDETGEFDRDKLERERQETNYRKRTYDIVLACRRFDEGTDLPFVSNVYYLGAPTSARLFIQLFGRAFRSKMHLEHYPKIWQNKAAITVFTPKSGKIDDDEHQRAYLRAHRQDVTLVAAYLADMELGDRVITELSDRLGGSLVFGKASEEKQEHVRQQISRLRGDDYTQAQARTRVNDIIATVAAEQDEVMGATSSKAVFEQILQIDDIYIRTRCVNHFIELVSDTHPNLGDELATEWTDTLIEKALDGTFDTDIHGAYTTMIEAVKAVAHSQAFLKLHKLSIDRGWLSVISRLTSMEDEQIAKQLRRLAMPRPTQNEIARTLVSFIQLEERYPNANSGKTDKYGLPGYTFSAIAKNWKFWNIRDEAGRSYTTMLQCGRDWCGLPTQRTRAQG